MKLQTQVPLKKATNKISYNSQLLLLGSCFVENIGDRLAYHKFQSVQNPFGILFHPKAIENLVVNAVDNKVYTEEDIFFLNERWHCFDAHSDLSAISKQELLQKLNDNLDKTYQQIEQSTHIIITLGTAWVYKHIKRKTTVANCHKVPQKEFFKEILSVKEIIKSLENIVTKVQSMNMNAQFIFTVSPVRHLKDGFVENQQSKAHLITAIHQFFENSLLRITEGYFESYEIMMDELRDYRFYAEDMIHPNRTAINYIWEKFRLVWIADKVNPIMQQVDIIQKGFKHRPFNEKSEQHQQFLKSLEKKILYLQNEYSFIKF